ncbi:hypothetical protein BV898_16745 [Hypsibius exemplaris]|uniref:Uncharacterized protein n=1 Tax=Hypsibius exemplaris TaxID=2072580 RepID=A0A9X6NDS3_HYPEX|nr:hypothetical protein BV898_16745 [Hypsibius exemplaris]
MDIPPLESPTATPPSVCDCVNAPPASVTTVPRIQGPDVTSPRRHRVARLTGPRRHRDPVLVHRGPQTLPGPVVTEVPDVTESRLASYGVATLRSLSRGGTLRRPALVHEETQIRSFSVQLRQRLGRDGWRDMRLAATTGKVGVLWWPEDVPTRVMSRSGVLEGGVPSSPRSRRSFAT